MNDAEKQKKLLRMMEEEQNQLLGISVSKKNSKQLQSRKSHSSTNLIRCSDCGGQVSTRASSCPKCGCPVDIELQKAAIRREIIKKETLLSDENKQLKERITKLKKETDGAIGAGCLVYVSIIGIFFIVGWLESGKVGEVAFGWFVIGLIVCAILGYFRFSRLFLSTNAIQQIDKLKDLESRLEIKKRESQNLADNLKNINSAKLLTAASAFGIHQRRKIHQELKELNENHSENGGDGSGGDSGGDSGWGDFEGF